MKESDEVNPKSSEPINKAKGIRSSLSRIYSSKPERQHTSRVKFKDSLEKTKAKSVKSVQFVRNTNVPVRKTHSVVSFAPLREDNVISDKIKQPDSTADSDTSRITNKINLNAPELCTSLKFANKLLEQAVCESRNAHRSNLDNTSSNSTKVKVLRKVNIPFEEQIYKDLVDLRVTEHDLFPDQEKRFRPKQFVRNKDKEPDLSEFYKPSYNEEFVIKPEKLKVEPEKVVHYNGFSLSNKLKRWESS